MRFQEPVGGQRILFYGLIYLLAAIFFMMSRGATQYGDSLFGLACLLLAIGLAILATLNLRRGRSQPMVETEEDGPTPRIENYTPDLEQVDLQLHRYVEQAEKELDKEQEV